MIKILLNFINSTGFFSISLGSVIMIVLSCIWLYLAIVKGFEPLLLIPIAVGMLLTNLPLTGLMAPGIKDIKTQLSQPGGLFYYLYQGVKLGIFPPLIFMGVGAMTDFGPLIANPKSLLLGAAAQYGIFFTFFGAIASGIFTAQEAASIGIIGGADGPTAIFLTSRLAPQ